jgi:hypothetical protein
MLRVDKREPISALEALHELAAFTKSEAMLPGDQFFQLQRVQDELRRVAINEEGRRTANGDAAK